MNYIFLIRGEISFHNHGMKNKVRVKEKNYTSVYENNAVTLFKYCFNLG